MAEENEKDKEAEASAEGEGGEGEGKKSKKKLIIIAAAVVVALLLGGAGAYFGGLIGGKAKDKSEHAEAGAEGEKKEGKKEGKEGEHAGPAFYELPQMLVNLNTGGKQASFIKTTVTLELENGAETEQVKANLPRLMDNYNTFLRELRATDLQGSAGVYRLREEMLTRANKVLAPVKVKDVLFKEIVIQ